MMRIRSLLIPGFTLATTALAIDSTLLKAVPAESIACHWAIPNDHPPVSGGGPDLAGLAAFLIDQSRHMGLLSAVDDTTRLWLDVAAAATEILRFPHAVMLIAVEAAPRSDGGHQLSSLKAALVVQCAKDTAGIQKRIQHLLNTYTNSQDSELTVVDREPWGVVKFKDRRLPEWAVLSWGLVGDQYVATVGAGAMDAVLNALRNPAASLAGDDWLNRVGVESGLERAAWALYLRPDRIRPHADVGLAAKLDGVLDALRLSQSDRALWTLGHSGRAVEIRQARGRGTVESISILAGPTYRGRPAERFVPHAATSYTIFDACIPTLVDGLSNAYLASCSPSSQRKAREFWGRIETESGISIRKDILSRLGSCMVIHDFPRHAFLVPIARTLLIRINDGSSTELRAALDRLLEYGQRQLADGYGPKLVFDSGGVWSLQYGIAGPALMVAQDWVVISFSPLAVRQAREVLVPSP